MSVLSCYEEQSKVVLTFSILLYPNLAFSSNLFLEHLFFSRLYQCPLQHARQMLSVLPLLNAHGFHGAVPDLFLLWFPRTFHCLRYILFQMERREERRGEDCRCTGWNCSWPSAPMTLYSPLYCSSYHHAWCLSHLCVCMAQRGECLEGGDHILPSFLWPSPLSQSRHTVGTQKLFCE